MKNKNLIKQSFNQIKKKKSHQSKKILMVQQDNLSLNI